jgi:hypothetical protein
LAPNENFTKTWRLKNNGSCTWTSSYALIFDSGDSMSGPASKQLTSGTVGPGETMDVSVNLIAPGSPGTYKGYWKLRNGSGVNFGIGTGGTNPFWVEIEVVPNTTTISAPIVQGESGQATKNGFVLVNNKVAGDNGANDSSQAFLSFNISAIPADAVITKVVIDLSDFTETGTAFSAVGSLYIFKDDYGGLDALDYVSGLPGSGRLISWSSTGSLGSAVSDSDMVNALQTKVGSSRFKLRLQFKEETDNDGNSDYIKWGTPTLEVTYYTP